ncbi:MAG: CAP domain-containing protein [Opitutae bacterium]|nr:CAP domain-containing protein [Opitutae bacterium]
MSFFRPRLCLLLAMVAAVHAAEKRDLTRLRPAEFARLPEVNAPIDLEHYDRDLLAAAIFHETNRWRAKLGLPAFRHLPKLDDAADVQVTYGSLMPELSHSNLLPAQARPMDRVVATGLRPGRVAENVALTPVFDTGEETPFVVHGAGAERKFLNADTGRELEPHTYASFAARVLGQWMNSPGHRANIANRALRYLGCSARSVRNLSGTHSLFAVQAFFTPAPPDAR